MESNQRGLGTFLEGKNAMARLARRALYKHKSPPKSSGPVETEPSNKPKPLIGGAEAPVE